MKAMRIQWCCLLLYAGYSVCESRDAARSGSNTQAKQPIAGGARTLCAAPSTRAAYARARTAQALVAVAVGSLVGVLDRVQVLQVLQVLLLHLRDSDKTSTQVV